MLNAHNLTVAFQGTPLFEGITFQLTPGDRVGLVGKNGAGKSTLLRIISREQEYDSGSIALDKEISIGFLKQDIDFTKGRTVLEESYQAFTEIKKLEAKLEDINTQLAERTDYESETYMRLVEKLTAKQERLRILGQNSAEKEFDRALGRGGVLPFWGSISRGTWHARGI